MWQQDSQSILVSERPWVYVYGSKDDEQVFFSSQLNEVKHETVT
jgi:hypothetical protein